MKAPRVSFLPLKTRSFTLTLLIFSAADSIDFLNKLHLHLGNQVGSLPSTAESLLSTGRLSKLSTSSVAELKLQAKMVEGRMEERKIKLLILLLLFLFRLCCYLMLVRCLILDLLYQVWSEIRNSQTGRFRFAPLHCCCTILVPVQPCSYNWL